MADNDVAAMVARALEVMERSRPSTRGESGGAYEKAEHVVDRGLEILDRQTGDAGEASS